MEEDFISLSTKRESKRRQKKASIERKQREKEILDDYVANTDLDFTKMGVGDVEAYLDMDADYSHLLDLQVETQNDMQISDNGSDILSLSEGGLNLQQNDSTIQRFDVDIIDEIPRAQRRKLAKQAKKSKKLSKRESADAESISLMIGPGISMQGVKQYLDKLNDMLVDFCRISLEDHLILPPMAAEVRGLTEILVKKYNIISKTMGKGSHKTMVLYRRAITRVPDNPKTVVDFILRGADPNDPPIINNKMGKKAKRTYLDKIDVDDNLIPMDSMVIESSSEESINEKVGESSKRTTRAMGFVVKTKNDLDGAIDDFLIDEQKRFRLSKLNAKEVRKIQKSLEKVDNNGGKKGKAGGKPKAKTPDSKLQTGDIIGQNAKAISQTNLGHKMLLSMGWNPGQGLGTGEGQVEPVKVVFKAERRGLGH